MPGALSAVAHGTEFILWDPEGKAVELQASFVSADGLRSHSLGQRYLLGRKRSSVHRPRP